MKNSNQQIISLEKNNLNLSRLKNLIGLIFRNENIDAQTQLNVIITNNQYLQELNKKFRNVNNATDVLSFPFNSEFLPKGISLLGDVYISLEKAKEQANEYSVPLQNEVERLMIHGILHLVGYMHKEKEETEEMTKKTEYYLNKIGTVEQ
jgi:probable rRNA maturation factor